MKKHKYPLLLHICCGPCATSAIDLLRGEYDPVGFFFNPNIFPQEEYVRRLKAAAKVCRMSNTALWVPEYRPEVWGDAVRGREADIEGGQRCSICYKMRIEAAGIAARDRSIPVFATTLTTSPRKSSKAINELGHQVAQQLNVSFEGRDFKKQDGFKRSVERSRELGLYRQKYCGCCFSL